MPPAAPKNKLLYVTDPMCSWCWGFSPVVESVTESFATRAPVAVILGGLAPGTTEPLDDRTKASIREHWNHVHEATGQPFDYGFFDRNEFVYDTEPPSRAVVAVRQMEPDVAMRFLDRLHAAFYRDNQDITDPETLCDLASDFGMDRKEFARQLDDESTRRTTRMDFVLAREMGISGFPSLIGHDGERLRTITVGYRPWEQISPAIDAWLDGGVEPSA